MGFIVEIALGVFTIILGLKGFSEDGLPWSNSKNITGTPAKIIGVLCLLFGVACFVAAGFSLMVMAAR